MIFFCKLKNTKKINFLGQFLFYLRSQWLKNESRKAKTFLSFLFYIFSFLSFDKQIYINIFYENINIYLLFFVLYTAIAVYKTKNIDIIKINYDSTAIINILNKLTNLNICLYVV